MLAVAALSAAQIARGDAASDRQIETAIASSQTFRSALSGPVGIRVQDGVVTLTGSVFAVEEKARAEEAAREVSGVVRVENRLGMSAPGRDRGDGWLELKIRSVLLLRPNVSARGTHVDVQDGVVTLTGEVETATQRELAAVYARNVEGVRDVRNELRVRQDASAAAVGEAAGRYPKSEDARPGLADAAE